jgi:hypothetical protein
MVALNEQALGIPAIHSPGAPDDRLQHLHLNPIRDATRSTGNDNLLLDLLLASL